MPTFLAPVNVSGADTNFIRVGTNYAGSGSIRLPNGLSSSVTWRNAANNNDIAALYVTSSDDTWVNTGSGKNLYMAHGGAAIAQFSSAGLTFNPGFNITTYGAGFKIGSINTEKIALWGATPIVQPGNTVAIDDLLVTTGLRASGGVANFTTAVSAPSATLSGAAPQLSLTSGTSNQISWAANGVGPPTFTTRSAGTKLVLYPVLSAAAADFALGVDTGTLWASVYDTTAAFKWYGGTTLAATLTGTGLLSALAVASTGLTGATAASRYVGATTSGKPSTGTFVKGDVVVDQSGELWVNTTAGTPGTWASVGNSYFSAAKWGVD